MDKVLSSTVLVQGLQKYEKKTFLGRVFFYCVKKPQMSIHVRLHLPWEYKILTNLGMLVNALFVPVPSLVSILSFDMFPKVSSSIQYIIMYVMDLQKRR